MHHHRLRGARIFKFLAPLFLLFASLPVAVMASGIDQLWGYSSVRFTPLSRDKWTNVRDQQTGIRLNPRISAWTTFQKIEFANRWVNSTITYKAESGDTWQTPAETYRLKTGDCEDFAILKRALLIKAGVPSSEIDFLIVRDTIVRNNHAYLVVNNTILDNRTPRLIKVKNAKDDVPLIRYNNNSGWLYGRRR